MARRVYGLDLKDLPLDRLSEQKHKKRRHQLQYRDKPSEIGKSKVLPIPPVDETKTDVTPSSTVPSGVVPSSGKDTDQMKSEESAPASAGNQDGSGSATESK